MMRPSYFASFLISLPNRRSRFAASRSCTSSGQVAYLIFLPRIAISSCAIAQSRWLFPAPGFPKISRFSLRSRNPPSNNTFICRLTFTGNRLLSKFARDLSSGSPDSLSSFPIRFRRREAKVDEALRGLLEKGEGWVRAEAVRERLKAAERKGSIREVEVASVD